MGAHGTGQATKGQHRLLKTLPDPAARLQLLEQVAQEAAQVGGRGRRGRVVQQQAEAAPALRLGGPPRLPHACRTAPPAVRARTNARHVVSGPGSSGPEAVRSRTKNMQPAVMSRTKQGVQNSSTTSSHWAG